MKTIFCPACGQPCGVTKVEEMNHTCVCPQGHKWGVLIDFDSKTSEDGTAIIAFQCDGTSAHALPEA